MKTKWSLFPWLGLCLTAGSGLGFAQVDGDVSPRLLRAQFSVGPPQRGQTFLVTNTAPYGLGPAMFPATGVFDEQTLFMGTPFFPPPVQSPDSADDDVYEYWVVGGWAPMMNVKIVDDGFPTVPVFGTGLLGLPPGAQPPPPQATLPTDQENIDALAVEAHRLDFYELFEMVFEPGVEPDPELMRMFLLNDPPLPVVPPPLYFQFSVDNSALGMPMTAVAQESYLQQAAGDLFEACFFSPLGSNALIADELALGLDAGHQGFIVPPVDDTDALIVQGAVDPSIPEDYFGAFMDWTPAGWIIDTDGDLASIPDTPFFYFSVDQPLIGITPGDILSPGVGAAGLPAMGPNIAISHLVLGLTPLDNLDALFVDRTANCVFFSLSLNSPSLTTMPNLVTGTAGADPGDLIFVNVGHSSGVAGPAVVVSANELGLLGSHDGAPDELNALWITQESFIDDNSPPVMALHPMDAVACPGDAVAMNAKASGGRSLVYQWFKDGSPLGIYGDTLILDPVAESDFGTYTCQVQNCFGSVTSASANLTDGALDMSMSPLIQARGLGPITFDPTLICAISNIQVDWFDLSQSSTTPIKTYTNPPWALVIQTDPAFPSQTTAYRVTVNDGLARASEQVTRDVKLLVAVHSQYFDYDNDGCNDVDDLLKLGTEWRDEKSSPTDPDPNGDDIVDILDFIYINVDGYGCP